MVWGYARAYSGWFGVILFDLGQPRVMCGDLVGLRAVCLAVTREILGKASSSGGGLG